MHYSKDWEIISWTVCVPSFTVAQSPCRPTQKVMYKNCHLENGIVARTIPHYSVPIHFQLKIRYWHNPTKIYNQLIDKPQLPDMSSQHHNPFVPQLKQLASNASKITQIVFKTSRLQQEQNHSNKCCSSAMHRSNFIKLISAKQRTFVAPQPAQNGMTYFITEQAWGVSVVHLTSNSFNKPALPQVKSQAVA